jgi:hypothetical protein
MQLHETIYIRLKVSLSFRDHHIIQFNCNDYEKINKCRLKNSFKYKLLYETQTKSKIF